MVEILSRYRIDAKSVINACMSTSDFIIEKTIIAVKSGNLLSFALSPLDP